MELLLFLYKTTPKLEDSLGGATRRRCPGNTCPTSRRDAGDTNAKSYGDKFTQIFRLWQENF
ncbi:MAG: hypothetical protein JXD22_00955 [Sedimentisphaerales bacterium]|nr:hypothetical protein [Sedimentisphaerales bacterium]